MPVILGTRLFHNIKVSRVINLTSTLFCQKGVYFGPGRKGAEGVFRLFRKLFEFDAGHYKRAHTFRIVVADHLADIILI